MRSLLLFLFLPVAAFGFPNDTVRIGTDTGTVVDVSGSNIYAVQSGEWTMSVNTGTSTVNATSVISFVSTSVIVTGGDGFSVIVATGTSEGCSIISPSTTSAYNFEIVTDDAEEYPVFGYARKIVGRASIAGRFILTGSEKIKIENANEDGTYKARCAYVR